MRISVPMLLALGMSVLGQPDTVQRRTCDDSDKDLWFANIGGYQHIFSVRMTCSKFVANPEEFDVFDNKSGCDCIDALFDEDLIERTVQDIDCVVEEDDGEFMSAVDYVRYMQSHCHKSLHTAHDPSKCWEDGHFDNDCCGIPSSTSCTDGYVKVETDVLCCSEAECPWRPLQYECLKPNSPERPRICTDDDSTKFFAIIGGYTLPSVVTSCGWYVANPDDFDVEKNPSTCDCVDTLFEEDIVETIDEKMGCMVDGEDHKLFSVTDYLEHMQDFCHATGERECTEDDSAKFFAILGGYTMPDVVSACGRFVANPEEFDIEKNPRGTCGCIDTLFEEDIVDTIGKKMSCVVEVEDGESISTEDYLRHMRNICHYEAPADCVDDPAGIVAADPTKDCANVGLHQWWSCDHYDNDFNGHSVFIWELCPKSCGKCSKEPRECTDEDANEFWNNVSEYEELRGGCWQFVANPESFNLEENHHSTCSCVDTLFEEGLVYELTHEDCVIQGEDDDDWMNTREYLRYMLEVCHSAPAPEPEHDHEGINGEEACEGHDFDYDRCMQVGCCHWNEEFGCMSDIGREICHGDVRECEDADSWMFWGVISGYQHLPSIRRTCSQFVADPSRFNPTGVSGWEASCECVDAMAKDELFETLSENVDCYVPGEWLGNEPTYHMSSYLDYFVDVCKERSVRFCTDDDGAEFERAVKRNGSSELQRACPPGFADEEQHSQADCRCLFELAEPQNLLFMEEYLPKCYVPGPNDEPMILKDYVRSNTIHCIEIGNVVIPAPGADGNNISKEETQAVLENVVEELKMLNNGDLPSARKNLKGLDEDVEVAKKKLKKFAKRVAKKLKN